ncbi:MAG: agmatinase family protein [Bacteroidales bacterium]
MSLEDKIRDFDPNGVGNTSNNIFGLPFEVSESRVVFIPVPWDVTVSNHEGTSQGPANIFENSFQIDLFDPLIPGAWKQGMAMEAFDPGMVARNKVLRKKAARYINFLEQGGDPYTNGPMLEILDEINDACETLCLELEMKALQYLENDQIPCMVGGEHSISLGLIRALARENPGFGILQIDAHADMRQSYQGFEYSHASIMHNALQTEGLEQIVQVGIRELCHEEIKVITQNPRKIKTYFDRDINHRMFEGETWMDICEEIAGKLPEKVYVSFDVDGLTPALCPGTGTPVPGGLSYNQALYLLETILAKGKKIIGADLVETGPGSIDGIISTRILYRLAGMLIKSNM